MKYSNLIEPYLYGNLSPEEEVVFERQLARDPALAEETARRLNKDKPYTPTDFDPSSEVESEESSASSNRLLATGLTVLLLCLLWWAMRPSGNNTKEADTKAVEQSAVQSEVPSR